METKAGIPIAGKHALSVDSHLETPRTSTTISCRWYIITSLCAIILLLWRFQCESPFHHQLTVEQRASKILSENPLIDGHNDLMIFLRSKYMNHIYSADFKEKFEHGGMAQHVDLPRLDQGKQGGAFWSAFMPCPTGNGTDFSTDRYSTIVRLTLDQLDLYKRLGQSYPKYFTPATDSSEALTAFKSGRLISPAGIEGLHQIGNSISTLRLYHQLGVRYATLTWNCHNKYADAACESGDNFQPKVAKPYWHGLSPAGRELVKEMNRMGMLVDLAHVSKETMKDVLVGNGKGDWKGSLAPPIFSHSSAYSICPHPRNVPDDILQYVKQRNSLVMINFSPGFISCTPSSSPSELPDVYRPNATLNQVVRHIRHVGELIGYDYVGIGTDYDGIDSTPVGLEDVSKFPDLVAELLQQGVSDADVAKIVGRNLLRVWKEADEVAARLQKEMEPLEDDLQNRW
ncbi:membrane dipeptidase-domain-containing protein [Clohesyomyces aquaticus]|uniref:Dipeptidase n=1 Tax=Clohesyomyces aquaticus TaxID=1231657 RepID=A0A1Y1Y0Q4_9PLEO|nr:membrane dipeptidase-domain-containing protein [Clohesyomyces aquaticus]